MDGTHLNNKIGIVGGGITGLISAYFLSLEGYKVDLYEKKTLLSETSSKTTKLIHGGIRYLENLQFHEVKNGINDRKWWLENFPNETKLQEIIILSKKKLSPEIFKFFFGIKVYEKFAGRSNIKTGRLYKQDNLLPLGIKNNISAGISFYDGLMQESVGQEIIKRCKSNGVNFYENCEIKSIRSNGRIEEKQYKKIIIATGPWISSFLKQNKIDTDKTIDFIKGSHLIINRKIKKGLMFRDQKKHRYIFALPYQGNLLLGTTEQRVRSPEDNHVLDSEVNYLLESINIYIDRPFNKDEIIKSYSGVRPLIKSKAQDFHSSSRDFYIQKDHNLLSLFGGKWTTAPSIARNIVRIVNNE